MKHIYLFQMTYQYLYFYKKQQQTLQAHFLYNSISVVLKVSFNIPETSQSRSTYLSIQLQMMQFSHREAKVLAKVTQLESDNLYLNSV